MPDPDLSCSAAPDACALPTSQGEALALARILGRLVTALELLTRNDFLPSQSEPAAASLPPGSHSSVREELMLARGELATLQGSGAALLSPAGRAAKSQQRADPLNSPHFGG